MRIGQLPAHMRDKITSEPCPVVGLSGQCWTWTRGCTSRGYGSVGYKGRTWSTHKLSYTLLVGSVPDGLTIDHLCRNIKCCNPRHMELVTRSVNSKRSAEHHRAENVRCPQDHPLADPNIILKARKDGSKIRNCRVCAMDYARKYRAARDGQERNYVAADRRRAQILAEAESNLIVMPKAA